jgi:hypothetical protein
MFAVLRSRWIMDRITSAEQDVAEQVDVHDRWKSSTVTSSSQASFCTAAMTARMSIRVLGERPGADRRRPRWSRLPPGTAWHHRPPGWRWPSCAGIGVDVEPDHHGTLAREDARDRGSDPRAVR